VTRPLNIGQAAQASGVSAKMIRHYEGVGLLPEAARSEAGYRQYTERDVRTLQFVRHARALGFSIDEIRDLLSLWQDRQRPSRLVRSLAQAHLDQIGAKLRELQAIQATLQHLVHCCHGDDRPECPIIDSLADPHDGPAVTPTAATRPTVAPARARPRSRRTG
jgi:MerR family copper efflux transcriptional regulator